jgi:hypothetical protein
MAKSPHMSPRVQGQIAKAGLPTTGPVPFVPALGKDRKARQCLLRLAIQHGPKAGQIGYLDTAGRIWIRDRAHSGVPDHWDVQENGGLTYFRVDDSGNLLP